MTQTFEQISLSHQCRANRLQAQIDGLVGQPVFRTKAEQLYHVRLLDRLEKEKAKALADAEAYGKLAAKQNMLASVVGTQAAE